MINDVERREIGVAFWKHTLCPCFLSIFLIEIITQYMYIRVIFFFFGKRDIQKSWKLGVFFSTCNHSKIHDINGSMY